MRRSRSPILPPFTREAGSRRPLYLQIRDFLRQVIIRGDLAPGRRLPSTRSLSNSLDVSRNTILSAYEALADEGLVRGKTGSGTCVNVSARRPRARDLQFLLLHSHYPADPIPIVDPDGNPLYMHR